MKFHPVKQTYGFNNVGRRVNLSMLSSQGIWLLPGAYDLQAAEERRNRCRYTYSFKNTPRKFEDMLFGLTDKTLNLAPGQYNACSLVINGKKAVHHAAFKSLSARGFHSGNQSQGPAPNTYEVPTTLSKRAVSAPFSSTVPRFRKIRSLTPGPGAYEKPYGVPKLEDLRRLGGHFGLYFSSRD
ncbi:hypothetical protein AHF37_03432 [Paragonimus kellicotti]|nr:hypothetical protein AHF37_03432 [Paragonimus kellicotti]